MSEKLTRNELTWLLTQEARSAAQKLRQGVGSTTVTESTPPISVSYEEGSGGVESTLNRLDEAVNMLASLHGHTMPRGRRGKIDLAALLWEVAPEARTQIEMGEGTAVFGDESELRRMLHVLIGQTGDPLNAKGTPEVGIKREGDEVRVFVNLGPETPGTYETERAWLSRMAVRYGGRLELDGSMQTLTLPADVDTHQRELDTLKKELAAAQAQGEAYARELAAVLSESWVTGARTSTGAPGSPSHAPASAEGLAVLVAALRGLGMNLRGILAAIGRDIAPLRGRSGDAGEIAASVARHITWASEIVTDLNRLGVCPLGELPRSADVAALLREVVRTDAAKAARRDVQVRVDAPPAAVEVVSVGALTALLQCLHDHAVGASPAGSEVVITLAEREDGLLLTFDDAGAELPAKVRHGVLSREFEALSGGRVAGLSLVAAHALAAHLRIPLSIADGHKGGRLELLLPRA